jgi:hypothetical protein
MIESSQSCLEVRISRSVHARKRHTFLQLTFILAVTCICALTTAADELRMTKIVFRGMSPHPAPDSLGAQPKTLTQVADKDWTLYRVGDKYSRIEEAPDPAGRIHTLSITREPDAWVINLLDNTARHIIDPGPTFFARLPMISTLKPNGQPDPDKEFQDLEFGNEVRFFRGHKARDLGLRKVEGKDCNALAIKSGGREVTLLLDPDTGKPVEIDVTNDGKPDFSIRYLSYEIDLPFDPSLFEPPQGLKITESK